MWLRQHILLPQYDGRYPLFFSRTETKETLVLSQTPMRFVWWTSMVSSLWSSQSLTCSKRASYTEWAYPKFRLGFSFYHQDWDGGIVFFPPLINLTEINIPASRSLSVSLISVQRGTPRLALVNNFTEINNRLPIASCFRVPVP